MLKHILREEEVMEFGVAQDGGQERVGVCNTDRGNLIRFLSSPSEFSKDLKDKFDIWKRKVAEKTRMEMREIKRVEMVKLEKIMEINWIPLYLFDYNLELEVLVSLIEFAGIEAFASANDVPVSEVIEIVSRYRTVHGSRLERLKKMQEEAKAATSSSSSGHQDQEQVDDVEINPNGEEVLGTNEINGLQQVEDGEEEERERVEDIIEVLKENPNGDQLDVYLGRKDEEHKTSENIKINSEEKQVDEIVKENPSGEDEQHNEKQEAITVENLQQEQVDKEKTGEIVKENPMGEDDQQKVVLEQGSAAEKQQEEVDDDNRKKEEERWRQRKDFQELFAYLVHHAKKSKKLKNPKRLPR